MATWIAPIDSETDPDAPLTSGLAKRWDNNVIAMTEGASGAPKVLDGALSTTVTTAGRTWVNNRMPQHNAGGIIIDRVLPITRTVEISTVGVGITYNYYWSFVALNSGSVRIVAEILYGGSGSTARIAIIRNGVTLVGEQVTSTASWETKTFDVSISAGDQITVRCGAGDVPSGNAAYMQNLRIQSDKFGPYRT